MATINVQTVQFTPDRKLLELIDSKIKRLEGKFQGIIDITVFLKLESKRSNIKDKVVEIRANMPGFQAFSSQVDKRFENALDHSIRKIRRQIRDAKRR